MKVKKERGRGEGTQKKGNTVDRISWYSEIVQNRFHEKQKQIT